MAKEVIPFFLMFSTKSLFWAGYKKEINVDPYFITSISSLFRFGLNAGCLTFNTTSAYSAYWADTILAPDATYF